MHSIVCSKLLAAAAFWFQLCPTYSHRPLSTKFITDFTSPVEVVEYNDDAIIRYHEYALSTILPWIGWVVVQSLVVFGSHSKHSCSCMEICSHGIFIWTYYVRSSNLSEQNSSSTVLCPHRNGNILGNSCRWVVHCSVNLVGLSPWTLFLPPIPSATSQHARELNTCSKRIILLM